MTTTGQDRVAEVAAAEACYESLVRNVHRVAIRLAEATTLGRDDIERAVDAIDVPPPSEALLKLVVDSREPDLMSVLLCSLVLRRSVKGTPYQDTWLAIFGHAAAKAVYDLKIFGLFELRLELLDELIARPQELMSLAQLYFQRSNTRRVLTMQDGDAMRMVIADLYVAIELARKEENSDVYVRSIASLAKLVARPASVSRDQTAAIAVLIDHIDLALKSSLSRHHQMLLLQARADLVRALRPNEAIDALETALAMGTPADPLWVELAAELVAMLVHVGRLEVAIERGLAFLAEPACQGQVVSVAKLHLTVGQALAGSRRSGEARDHFIAGLEGVRGHDRQIEIAARLLLAALGVAEADLVLVDEQLRILRDRGAELDDMQRGDVCDLRAKVAALQGDLTAERAALDEAVLLPGGELRRTQLLLRRALVDLSSKGSVEDLNGVLARAIELEPDSEIESLVQRLAAEHTAAISSATRELLRGWAQHRGLFSMTARLLHFDGRASEAVAELRRALGAALAPEERLQCVHLLVVWLGPSDIEERRARCGDLANLLEQVGDHPHVRLDLALGLHVTARKNVDALRSAWAHATRALGQVRELRIVAHGQGVLARLAVDIVKTSLPASTVDAVDKASWLDAELQLPAAQLGPLRLAAASMLLVPGPLVLPRALDVARRLLQRARADLVRRAEPDVLEALARFDQRLAWIDQRIAGRGAAGSPDDGPFDDVPPWLIDLVAGRAPMPSTGDPAMGEAIERALVARPDLHDQLLTAQRWIAVAGAPSDDRGRVRAWFHKGVAMMQEAQRDPLSPATREKVASARRLLGDAVRVARHAKMAELFDCLVSLGNAWRIPPEEEVGQALSFYDEAAPLDAPRESRAKLWKVHADALYQRGGDDDIRRAERLLVQALEVRRDGWLRVETLVSAAHVARAHPDRNDAERALQAAEHLMAAVRADQGHAEQVLRFLVACLTDWSRHRPEDLRPGRYREELRRLYPGHSIEIDARWNEADPSFAATMVKMLDHPAARAFMAIRTRLMTPRERRSDPHGLLEQLGPAGIQHLEEAAVRESLLERPDEAEKVLASLAATQDGDARPGTVTGEVLLLALLARAGRRLPAEVRERTGVAITEAATVGDLQIHALLLRELACVWAPNDHAADPVRDFSLATMLLQRVVELEGGEATALLDTLGFLARALRYSSDGSTNTNLRESRRLYQFVLKRVRGDGDPDRLANILHNLAEVEEYIGEGERHVRLRHVEVLTEEAARVARAPDLRASYQASLAWVRTQLGAALEGDDGRVWLERAKATFELVVRDQLAPALRQAFDGHRTTCYALLEERSGQRSSAIARYRRHLEEVAAGAPHFIAIAQHNLASALLFGGDVTTVELREGLMLSHKAAAVRSIERDPRHHWETAFNAGRAILYQLDAGRIHTLPMSQREAWTEALQWFRQAIAAARALGPGQELTDSGFALSRLARHITATAQAIATAEEAWSAVRDAMAFLLTAPTLREREAQHALQVACDFAVRLAAEAVAVASPGLAFMLVGERAEVVERWLLRAQLPTRRPIRARLAHPDGVSPLTWQEWQVALKTAGPRGIVAALQRVRTEAPGFLAEEGDVSSVARWLEARPRSAAVAAFTAGPGVLAWLMTVDDRGRRKTCILGLEAPPPPIPPESLAMHMGAALDGGLAGSRAQAAMGEWARRYLAEPIERMLGGSPAAVLWCPGPGLRLIAPSAMWTASPVAVTTAMEGPDQRAYPSRHRSTLIALADPGPGAGANELGEHGRRAVQCLVAAAEPRGAVRRMGSAGRRFGRALLGDDAGVRDTPASPQDLLAEAAEHDVVVIIAHGELSAEGDAALLCIDRDAAIVRLTDDMLADSPAAFAGSTVVLLSCSAGQVTSALADPGGVAGTLLSAGARCVVAPMWPVRLDAATHVAELVLRGSVVHQDPAQVLTYVQRRVVDSGPVLGGPPASTEDRQSLDALQHLAFIAWVG